jgi:hypothetical protein
MIAGDYGGGGDDFSGGGGYYGGDPYGGDPFNGGDYYYADPTSFNGERQVIIQVDLGHRWQQVH